MQRPIPIPATTTASRRGVIVPLVAIAILVVGGGIALVLDRLWLASAKSEILTVAEGAALAACRSLIDEELLKYPNLRQNENDWQQQRIDVARQTAGDVAAQNTVAGNNVSLDLSETGDVRFGRLTRQPETDQVLFLETNNRPTSVVVSAYRSRSRNNPVALLFQELTDEFAGDVAARAEATWGNCIVGLRPHQNLPAPVLPIAVLENDSTGTQLETWMHQIEQFHGNDRYRFDSATGAVTEGFDGIPEIVLQWSSESTSTSIPNHCFIELGPVGERNVSLRQLKTGWRPVDLQSMSGEIRLSPNTIDLWGRERLTQAECRVLKEMIGECRIVCLCKTPVSSVQSQRRLRLTLTRFVGARIMAVDVVPQQKVQIVLQPAVVITRTALPATLPGDEATSTV
ncbi:MAG: hypothetical protein WD065_12295, partial [Planctomycetaceae bacterium]